MPTTKPDDRDNEPSEFGGRRGQPRGAGTSASDEYMRQRQETKEEDARLAKRQKEIREARRTGAGY